MSLYDKLNDDPRVQNCFPKLIAVVDRKHAVLTDNGIRFPISNT